MEYEIQVNNHCQLITSCISAINMKGSYRMPSPRMLMCRWHNGWSRNTFLIDLGVKLAHEKKTKGSARFPRTVILCPSFVSLQVEHENHHHLLAAYFFPTLELLTDGGFSAIFPSWQLATKNGFIQPEMIMKHVTCSQDAREDHIYMDVHL